MTAPQSSHIGLWKRIVGPATSNGDTLLIVAAMLVSIPLAAAAIVADGGQGWLWWQWLVVLALASDLGGGMLANMLPATKRWYHSPGSPDWRLLGFTAIHLHLPVMALMLPAWMPMQAAWLGYIWLLGGAVLLLAVPMRLRLPAALAISVIGTVLLARLVPLDSALGWMPLVLFLKLLAGHMIPPERT